MNKNVTSFATVFILMSISIIFLCFFMFDFEKNNDLLIIEDVEIIDDVTILEYAPEELAYLDGLRQGKRAVYSQFLILGKIEEKDIPEEEFVEYTSNFVESEMNEEEKKFHEKGYVDGYHKTIESFYCPAGGDY